jgi:DNA repair protein RecO
MILNVPGVVLARRDFGESDSLAVVYTETLGKLTVRFVGVKKPGRKLKALAEPIVWAEYRLYLGPRSDMAKAVGGRIISSFPGIRADLSRTVSALWCLDFLSQITPERSSNEGKYRLICEALSALDVAPHPCLESAYGLRLLELSGYSLRGLPPRGFDSALWESLHGTEFVRLPDGEAGFLKELICDHAETQLGRPLRSARFLERLIVPC